MKNKLHKECPGFEELSAYFDGELDSSSLEYKHIATCKNCRDELEAFQKVSDAIKQEFLAEVPDGFANKIIIGIKKREEENSVLKPFPLKALMRVAALVIISSLIILDLIPREKNNETLQPQQKELEPLVFLNRSTLSNHLTSVQSAPSRSYAAGAHNAIDIRKMVNVSTGNMPSELISLPFDNSKKIAQIPLEVHQVWSVDSLPIAQKQIMQLIPSARFARGNKSITMRANLTKKNLAEFVRHFKGEGVRLLSPVQPQPEQRVFAGNQNKKVDYSATLVEPE